MHATCTPHRLKDGGQARQTNGGQALNHKVFTPHDLSGVILHHSEFSVRYSLFIFFSLPQSLSPAPNQKDSG